MSATAIRPVLRRSNGAALPGHTLEERILDNVVALDDEDGGCWVWSGSTNGTGYGKTSVRHVERYVHRLAYEVWVGSIPEGLQIDHVCRNRRCCNPEHLRVVTCRENLLASPFTLNAINAEKQKCVNGHDFDEANTYRTSRGRRACRACNRDRQRQEN